MKPHNLLPGLGMAFVLSAISLPILWVLLALRSGIATQVLITFLSGGYLGYLLMQSRAHVGRIILATVSAAGLGVACLAGASSTALAFIALGLIWGVRSLLNYSSLVTAFLDALLCVVSVGVALAAAGVTRSTALTVWCFFLVQALWVYIPRRMTRFASAPETTDRAQQADTFERAHRAAEAAIRSLAQQPDS